MDDLTVVAGILRVLDGMGVATIVARVTNVVSGTSHLLCAA